jgi:hypothetical protein
MRIRTYVEVKSGEHYDVETETAGMARDFPLYVLFTGGF